MKISFKYIWVAASFIGFFSCKKDNFEAPNATLNGRIVYQGEPIPVERNQVPFELYQYGFGRVGPIASTIAQDGSYSAILFNGDYKLIVPNGQGPFLWPQTASGAPDSINITVTGDQTLDVEVTPYYMIRNPQITAGGGNVNATFSIEKIITDANAKDVERVSLYINKTQFVSGGDNIASNSIEAADITDMNNISISVTVPSIIPPQNYVYARVGLKIAGVEDVLFSPLVQVTY